MFFDEFARSTETFFNVLQADKLHWTVKCALHDMTIEAMIEPMTHAIYRLLEEGFVKSKMDADAGTLAGILIKGSEALIHSFTYGKGETQRMKMLRNSLNDYWKLIIEF